MDKECCIGCGAGAEECPGGARTVESYAVVNENDCIECGHGVEVCPNDCITME